MKKRLVVAALAIVVALVGVRMFAPAAPVIGYRPIDDYNIGVGVIGTRAQWRGVSVEETASTVKVEVRQISIQGPGFDDTITYVVVALREPLGTRMVVNGLTGLTLLPMTP